MLLWIAAVALAKPSVCLVGQPGTKVSAGSTSLVFVSGKQLAETEARHADAERREPLPTPVHGLIVLRFDRSPVQLANPDNQVIVIESDGQQLVRREPDTPEPELPAGMRERWGELVVPLPDEAAFPITVHSADRTLGHRCSWSISWDGSVKRL